MSVNTAPANTGLPVGSNSDAIYSMAEMASILEKSGDKISKEVVEDVLSRYSGHDYQKFVEPDSGGRYSRGEVCTGSDGKFCILVMTWMPSNGSAIHSHGDSECSLKLLEGDHLEERVYRVNRDQALKLEDELGKSMDVNIDITNRTAGASEKGSIGYVNDSIGPHSIWNMDPNRHAVSLHVYYPAYDKCWVFDDNDGSGKICLVQTCADKAPCTNATEFVADQETRAPTQSHSSSPSTYNDKL